MTWGDVLVATPLVSGIRKAFPESQISIGVGDWAKPLLENNSDLDQIVPNAPWHNKQNCHFPANSLRTYMKGLCYVYSPKKFKAFNPSKILSWNRCIGESTGIMVIATSKNIETLGVKGYAGGKLVS